VKCQSLYITLDDSQQNSKDHRLVDKNMLEEHILLLLSDLIVIAITKFERVRGSSVLTAIVKCLCWNIFTIYIIFRAYFSESRSKAVIFVYSNSTH
jgi:hypothetical protein